MFAKLMAEEKVQDQGVKSSKVQRQSYQEEIHFIHSLIVLLVNFDFASHCYPLTEELGEWKMMERGFFLAPFCALERNADWGTIGAQKRAIHYHVTCWMSDVRLMADMTWEEVDGERGRGGGVEEGYWKHEKYWRRDSKARENQINKQVESWM